MAVHLVVTTRIYARVVTQSKVEPSVARSYGVIVGSDELLHWIPASNDWPSRKEIIRSARPTAAQVPKMRPSTVIQTTLD